MKKYTVKEMFYSLQGEGTRAGTANVFVRFSGCNLDCRRPTHGFDCDTDFQGGVAMTAEEIVNEALRLGGACRWVILTGGEPLLQVDEYLLSRLRDAGYMIALETNGTLKVPEGFTHICVSPKRGVGTAQKCANEVKVVLDNGGELPAMSSLPIAINYLISPAFQDGQPLPDALEYCITLVRNNPRWRLSVQQHKMWRVR